MMTATAAPEQRKKQGAILCQAHVNSKVALRKSLEVFRPASPI